MINEQELKDRCTPEFIKFMVELAEGFRDNTTGNVVIIDSPFDSWIFLIMKIIVKNFRTHRNGFLFSFIGRLRDLIKQMERPDSSEFI